MFPRGWEKMKNLVLGKRYDLSLVFAGDKLMKSLNSKYGKKPASADVLAFPISKNMGEIFLNKSIKNEERKIFLFIHALLHLKEFEHGEEMERREKAIIKKYKKN